MSLVIGVKDPTKQGLVNTYMDTKALQLNVRMLAIKTKVATMQSSLPGGSGSRHLPAGGSEESGRAAGVSGAGALYHFQKPPFPDFDGQKKNFPSFHREWTDTVS